MHVEFSYEEVIAKCDESGGRILLGINTGSRVVMLQSLWFRYSGVSFRLYSLIHTYVLDIMYAQF